MSRFGNFLSDTFSRAKSHEPSWIQKLPSMPGSPQSLQDAFIKNKWNSPYGNEQNSMDIFAGGTGHPAGSEHPWARKTGRAVGSFFLGRGLNNATGTNWAGPAARAGGSLFGQGGGAGAESSNNGNEGNQPMSIWSNIGNAPQVQQGQHSIDETQGQTPLLYDQARQLAGQGRMGDSNLLHVSDDELQNLQSTGRITQNPRTGLPEAFSLGNVGRSIFGGGGSGGGGGGSGMFPGMPGVGNIFGGALGMGLGNRYGQDLNDATNRGVEQGNPLNNPQRQPYQQQLTSLMNDPSGFMNSDPFINSSKKAIGDQYQSNFAKSGNLPMESILGSSALQQMMSQAYNDRVRQLTTLGGFDQGPGYSGNIAYQGGASGAQGRNNSITNGLPQIFGGLGQMFGQGGGGGGSADISSLFGNSDYMGGGGMGF